MAVKRASKAKTERKPRSGSARKVRTERKPKRKPKLEATPDEDVNVGRDPVAELEALEHLAGGDFALFIERAKLDVSFPHEPDVLEVINKLDGRKRVEIIARLKEETKVRIAPFEAALRAVKGTGADPGDDGLPGKPLTFEDIEPWPDPVDGAELLTQLSSVIGSYVVMDKHQRDATALWVVHAHAHDLRDISPPLVVKAPVMRSGKTKLLETLERLVPRPLLVSGITAAFLERAIEAHRPTLMIDEYDALTSNDPALAEAARAQLNRSSRRRGARVGKSVPLPGGGYESRLFSTWAPTAIAGIGKPPPTIMDRSIPISLKRKLSVESVKPLRDRDGADLVTLGRKVARFVSDNEATLRVIEPQPPLAVDNDRAKDMWEPLLAIADVAGGDWPRRAREAGRALVRAAEEDDDDLKLKLLGDIRELFLTEFPDGYPEHEGRPDDGPRLASATLVKKLLALEDRPYGALGKMQKPLTQHGLGRILRDFEIRPTTVRPIDSSARAKGYYLHQFEDVFARYLSASEKASESFHSPTPSDSNRNKSTKPGKQGESEDFNPLQEGSLLRSKNAGNPSNSGVCDFVTDQKPGATEVEGYNGDSEGAL